MEPQETSSLRSILRSYFTTAGKQAARNLMGLALCIAIGQSCVLLTLLVLANSLALEGFGAFSFALTLQSYLAFIGGAGASPIYIREGAQRPEELDRLTTSYLLLTAISASFICLLTVTAGLGLPLSDFDREAIIFVAVGNIFASISLIPLYDVHHRQALSAVLTMVADILALALIVILAHAQTLTPAIGVLVFCAKWAVAFFAQLLVYHWTVRPLRWCFRASEFRDMVYSSLPVVVAMLTIMVPLSAGVLLVRLLRNEAETGLYGFAYQFAYAYLLLAGMGIRIAQPHIAGRYGLNRGFITKLLLFGAALLATLALGGFMVGLVLTEFILDPIYRRALVPLILLLLSAAALSVCSVLHVYLIRFRDTKSVVLIHLAVAILYVALCYLLVPIYSILAAAGLSLFTTLVALVANYRRVTHLWNSQVVIAKPGENPRANYRRPTHLI